MLLVYYAGQGGTGLVVPGWPLWLRKAVGANVLDIGEVSLPSDLASPLHVADPPPSSIFQAYSIMFLSPCSPPSAPTLSIFWLVSTA